MHTRSKKEEREIITNGDLLARLDILLGKEDGDVGGFVVDGGRVRLTWWPRSVDRRDSLGRCEE